MSNVYKLDTSKTVHKLWSPKPKVNPAWRVGSASSVVNFDPERISADRRIESLPRTNEAFMAEYNRLHDRRWQVWNSLKATDWYAAGGRYSLKSMLRLRDRVIDTGLARHSDPAAWEILVQLDLLTNEINVLCAKWDEFVTKSKAV